MAVNHPQRLTIVHASILLFASALIGKAGYEQLYRYDYWNRLGQREHYASSGLAAPRGLILDATGHTLVESREMIRISVAPRQVKDRPVLARELKLASVEPRFIAMSLDTLRKWVDIPGVYLPSEVAAAMAQKGVFARPVMDRVYATSGGIRRIVGRVGPDGKAMDGVELALDSLLQGDTATVRVARDKSGRALAAPVGSDTPTAGNTVVLTINRSLQEICDRALAVAVDSLHADGGDIVVMNPNNGDVLAMASNRSNPAAVANTAVTEPYEPGSTMKPFVAARLIGLGRATPATTIDTYNGRYTINGRTITDADEHASVLSLSDVIKHSSNVGIVRFADRLSVREKFELLRDMGFGTPTAVSLPAESQGIVRDPTRWTPQSAASVVMGYEVSVTPLQMVTAYSAIANGGELLAPHVIKEIRSADGTVRYAARRTVVRRVMASDVAAQVRVMLRDVVAGGTSTKADLATLDVAGKSGTALRNAHGRYIAGSYTASFVGLFPDDKPQFVILVKLDNPQMGYYGGVVAGGVTNVVLRAALAARDAALDRGELASAVHAPRSDTSAEGRLAEQTRAASARRSDSAAIAESLLVASRVLPADAEIGAGASYVVTLPSVPRPVPPVVSLRPVPDITGLPLRSAVRALHAAGFRVQLVQGATYGVVPATGTMLEPGRVVRLNVKQ
ncbi:MAG: penicillin-binding transpeptidase domain-containing protein [Gemmatimonadota bacterium]|nr:penicillin-binding transpeptidase domain-containing protein [Gemmatimonadota bacterium]